ncbi:MAG: alpha/beta hydrolase [Cephaloticoccus sp.]|nr:alpha/beta hydrolase [Cephaloticoccus sp.]
MPALTLAPVLSFFSAFQRVHPSVPLRTFLRTTSHKLRPARLQPHLTGTREAQERVLARGAARGDQLATIWHESHPGSRPTIVLGGFVPDATEQVLLLRGHLAKSGPVYYVHYPADGFSFDLLCAQLDDLIADLARTMARPPVLFTVSYGSGLALAWLRRHRESGRSPRLGGLILISPVACLDDLMEPAAPKPTTLLGRAIKPYLESGETVQADAVEKSRAVFARMFEAGAQNKAALQFLLTRGELTRLRAAVTQTIRQITPRGAVERVRSLCAMPRIDQASPHLLPLTEAPVLILYAEKESAVLVETSPTRRALLSAAQFWFPHSETRVITNPRGAPVQHASLIFHGANFLPPILAFYRRLKSRKIRVAA